MECSTAEFLEHRGCLGLKFYLFVLFIFSVLMKCLEVNDRLTRNLSDIDAVTLVDPAAAPSTEDDFDAFLSDRPAAAFD